METFLTDSDPLVALLSQRDEYPDWACEQFKHFSSPLPTCEGTITEVTHLLSLDGLPSWGVLELLECQIISIQFGLESTLDRVLALIKKNTPTRPWILWMSARRLFRKYPILNSQGGRIWRAPCLAK